MQRNQNTRMRQNVFWVFGVFVVNFYLLYALGTKLHRDQKIKEEIQRITLQNEAYRAEIEEKKEYLSYLETPQRIEKEAKIQMGRKNPGEEVLVIIKEKLDVVPPPQKPTLSYLQSEDVPNWKKWKWRFFGRW